MWSHRFGETDILSFGIKDGIVLPDEDVTQDPELLGATLTKASDAFIITLYREKRCICFFSPELCYSLFSAWQESNWPERCRPTQGRWSRVRLGRRWRQTCCGCSDSSPQPAGGEHRMQRWHSEAAEVVFIASFQLKQKLDPAGLFLFDGFDVRALNVCLLWVRNTGKIHFRWYTMMVWLTSPSWLVEAPSREFSLLMSAFGPTIREVPVSTMAWQPS